MPNLVEIGRGCPEGFAFNWLNTSAIRHFIIKSFSSINIFFQNIFPCKVQILEESLLHRMFYCLVCRFPLRVTSSLSKGFRIPESGKFWPVESGIQQIFVVESGILGFGIRSLHLKESVIPLTLRGIRNSRLSWIPLHVAIPQLW